MKKDNIPNSIINLISLIKQEIGFVNRGKSSKTLLQLFNDYELDPFLNQYDATLLYDNISAFILEKDYLGLSHFLMRKHKLFQNDPSLQNVYGLCNVAISQNFTTFYKHIYQFIKNFTSNIQVTHLEKAIIGFGLKTLAKYYVNLPISKVVELLGTNENKVIQVCKREGHQINVGYVEFNNKNQRDTTQLQLTTLSKMKQIAEVASAISKYE